MGCGFAAAVILGGTGAAAGYRMLITHSVNGEVLPELDPMRVVEIIYQRDSQQHLHLRNSLQRLRPQNSRIPPGRAS